jgi:hypothetical protein
MTPQGKRQGHPDCYAQALCECRGPVNREHYVSESILELVFGRAGEVSTSVLVRGLRFQRPGVLEEKGVARLVGKILCKGHNSFLGRHFDPAGLAMFKAMDALNDAASNLVAPEQRFRIDGDGLERWMLKTFIGGFFSGNFPVARGETMKGVYPPPEWLQILFKGAEFPDGIGFHWLAGTVGCVYTADEEVLQFEPILEQGTEAMAGMRVRFFGFNFALSMGRILPNGSGLFENVAYRPAGIRVEGSNIPIEFGWKAGPAIEEIVVVRRTHE